MDKKTMMIGIGLGVIISVLGLFSFATSYGIHMIEIDDTFQVGDSTTYSFSAPKSSKQYLNITADSFEVFLRSPRGGLQINDEQFKKELSIEWIHLEDGDSRVTVKNTGDSVLKIEGSFNKLGDTAQTIFDIIILSIGFGIIGYSIFFSMRRSNLSQS